MTEVGRKGMSPSVLKSFRFKHEDVLRLARLGKSLPARSDTEVIRMALELLAVLELVREALIELVQAPPEVREAFERLT